MARSTIRAFLERAAETEASHFQKVWRQPAKFPPCAARPKRDTTPQGLGVQCKVYLGCFELYLLLFFNLENLLHAI